MSLKTKIIIPVCLIGFFIIGWYSQTIYSASLPGKLLEIRENSNKYHYINPLLLVDNVREAPELNDIKDSISNYVNKKTENSSDSISVYFRALNSGKWIGVNQDAVYDPSSMLKVAVMLGYLKKADDDPGILLKKLNYNPKVDPGQYYKPEHAMLAGSYTVHDLIIRMITESDNDALAALYDNDREAFVDVLKTLEIPPPATANTLEFLSPKKFSSIFRTLYSSTYLSREVSEQALQLLTYTTFNKGIVAGVPANTIVAHKFGEHGTLKDGKVESRELHDCGIIYYQKDPYLLCVMTKGQDFSSLEKDISDISKLVYDKVDKDKVLSGL